MKPLGFEYHDLPYKASTKSLRMATARWYADRKLHFLTPFPEAAEVLHYGQEVFSWLTTGSRMDYINLFRLKKNAVAC